MCCNDCCRNASNARRKDNRDEHTGYTASLNHHLEIDPAHSVAEFKVKHMMISNVKGQFAKVTGVLTLDESDLTNSRVEALIEAGSIETRDAQRDAHLKSADFFHVEKFPTLSFKSARISVVREGEPAVEGDLTIRDVTRKVLFSIEGPTHLRRIPGAIPELRYQRPPRSTAKTSA
jgi:polyisoprenoid-binding protein YceI